MTMFKSVLGAIALLVVGFLALEFFTPVQPFETLGARIEQKERTVFTTSTNANPSSLVVNVNDFRHMGVTMAATAASGTLKFKCSLSDDAPSFGATQSATNRWDYVQAVDTEDGSAIDGDTGVTLADTTDVRQFEINSNNFRWCTAELLGNTTPAGFGTTTILIRPMDNQ